MLAAAVILPCITMIREKLVQWDMKEALEEKELLSIVIDEQEVVWEEDGEECRINGRLFDVKEFESVNGQYKLKGLYDDREKEIENQLADLAEKQKEQQGKLSGKLFKFNYVRQEKPTILIRPIIFSQANLLIFSENIYNSPFLKVFSPPPEKRS